MWEAGGQKRARDDWASVNERLTKPSGWLLGGVLEGVGGIQQMTAQSIPVRLLETGFVKRVQETTTTTTKTDFVFKCLSDFTWNLEKRVLF